MNRPYECNVSKKRLSRFSLADHQRHLLMTNNTNVMFVTRGSLNQAIY